MLHQKIIIFFYFFIWISFKKKNHSHLFETSCLVSVSFLNDLESYSGQYKQCMTLCWLSYLNQQKFWCHSGKKSLVLLIVSYCLCCSSFSSWVFFFLACGGATPSINRRHIFNFMTFLWKYSSMQGGSHMQSRKLSLASREKVRLTSIHSAAWLVNSGPVITTVAKLTNRRLGEGGRVTQLNINL